MNFASHLERVNFSLASLAGFLILSLGVVRWYLSKQRFLAAIPTVGWSFPLLSYITAMKYKHDSRKVSQEGYERYKGGLFKTATMDYWMVYATSPQLVEDIRRAPDDILSANQAVRSTMQTDYTMGMEALDDPYHITVIKTQLTRNLGKVFSAMREELVAAFDEAIPAISEDWLAAPMHTTLQNIVCRVSNRIFVGAPKCRDKDYHRINIDYTAVTVETAMFLNRFPSFLKPVIGPLVSQLETCTSRQVKHLEPIIEERQRMMAEEGDEWENKPKDVLQWLMDAAIGEEQSPRSLSRRILLVNFAAIHTSALTFTHVMYHLAANPEYQAPLREEVETIIAEEGWTKAAMSRMWRVDSFIRESQRVNGMGEASMMRLALRPFTFSNGMTVPPGTMVCASAAATHVDEMIYPRGDVFDGFRFADMRSADAEATKHQMVTTNPEYLTFGYGKHACPGRFFAANELKAMLSHVVMTYDVKFEEGKGMPANIFLSGGVLPAPAQVLFRRRPGA
ncbi:cytochrome P450 [Auriscalpium vulgare]|uniref:Cytochrome P450 n=1 Tax=Auriscalpium vulgare TaxID=40419 RepID=A0ACB8RRA4_9AGAM|nr:cytochrome P450 [Auriscalpium vulgare]